MIAACCRQQQAGIGRIGRRSWPPGDLPSHARHGSTCANPYRRPHLCLPGPGATKGTQRPPLVRLGRGLLSGRHQRGSSMALRTLVRTHCFAALRTSTAVPVVSSQRAVNWASTIRPTPWLRLLVYLQIPAIRVCGIHLSVAWNTQPNHIERPRVIPMSTLNPALLVTESALIWANQLTASDRHVDVLTRSSCLRVRNSHPAHHGVIRVHVAARLQSRPHAHLARHVCHG